MSEAIMPSLKYQKLINPETHAAVIIEHDKRIEELEKHTDDIQEFKKLAAESVKEAHGAIDIAKATAVEQKHDIKEVKIYIDANSKSIKDLQDQFSGVATEEGIRRDVSEIFIQHSKRVAKEKKEAASRRMKYILGFGIPILGFLITMATSFFNESVKIDKQRDIELIKTAIQEVLNDRWSDSYGLWRRKKETC